ncbi:hypothetical protein [uncultured Tateyamaria sp.]|uniref:hypothetical protein n=1 Tax=uncultured Tateyamaria sp. TaxID=455651 RepID=UPI00260349C5|nr:hypothetical protein [uncultured Tateyamaria sp.]
MIKAKEAALKAAIVLVPSYTAAYLTDKMVWVVPTLAAAGFFAGTISLDQSAVRRRVDDDGDADGHEHEYEQLESVTELETEVSGDGD